jgi:predicted NBD/HSP70 family sugar kinase
MYVGVDVGGTKTLVAVLDGHGVIKQRALFPTPKTYDNFLLELRHLAAHFEQTDFKAGAVGITGRIDRKHGRRHAAGKLAWENVPVQADTERIFGCPMVVENDAKLAGLSEAMLVKDKYSKVLYITVSTGIGFALITDGVIDTSISDRGGTNIMLEHRGKLAAWESFASGRAIAERYGKKAKDISDEATWKRISRNLAQGMIQLIAVMEPDVIVIGGGVGTYFERYGALLAAELKRYELPTVAVPALMGARRPEEAVVYGCYDLAKQVYGHA